MVLSSSHYVEKTTLILIMKQGKLNSTSSLQHLEEESDYSKEHANEKKFECTYKYYVKMAKMHSYKK